MENTQVNYRPKEKRIQNTQDSFSEQEITFDNTPLLFPPSLEKVFLVLYFIALPYIAGLLFLFFYVGEGDSELFFSINEESSFLFTWAIGYEILAGILMLYIIKSALSFTNRNSKNKPFQRP